MDDGLPWPRISIVTPTLNQGQFIEETIRSVLLQGYPDLEYIIIDGGSTDNSVDIIKKYESWLTYWISEPDHGQSHAINKGFKRASGEIMAWLNSDDIYTPGALHAVADAVNRFRGQDGPWNGWLIGHCLYQNLIENRVEEVSPSQPPDDAVTLLKWRCPQRSTFWSRSCWELIGGLPEDLHFSFDTEFFLRLVFANFRLALLPDVLAVGRIHKDCKTLSQAEAWGPEVLVMYDRLAEFLPPLDRRHVRNAARATLARVAHQKAKTGGDVPTAILSAARFFWYSMPWNRTTKPQI
jgi:glycosyltransferase involved in cell wall biosynthesis